MTPWSWCNLCGLPRAERTSHQTSDMCLISFGPRQSRAKEDMVHSLHTYGHEAFVTFPKIYDLANYGGQEETRNG